MAGSTRGSVEMNLHEPGECPYGHPECDGVGVFGPDPYASEINLDDTEVWECEGHRYESGQDI